MNRPKNLKVYLQPYAGKKCVKSLFAGNVQPLFTAAGITTDIIGNCAYTSG